MNCRSRICAYGYVFIGILLCSQKIFSEVRGIVKDSLSGQAIQNAQVVISGSSTGTTTDENGRFLLTANVSDGSELIASHIGYKKVRQKINLNNAAPLVFALEPTSIELDEVKIVQERYKEIVSQHPLFKPRHINAKDVESIGALDDVMRYYAIFPGVSQKTDLNSLLYIRGGSPDQNLVLIDDIPILNPYALRLSLLGGVSLINKDLLESAELLDDGFGARYGNRLASVINVRYKEGDKYRFGLASNFNLTAGTVSIEGPFSKGKGSFVASYGETYLDFIMNSLNQTGANYVIPNRRQLHSKIVHNFNADNKLCILFILEKETTGLKNYSPENLNLESQSSTRIFSVRQETILNSNIFATTTISSYQDKNDFQFFDVGNIFYGGGLTFNSETKSLREELTWLPLKKTEFLAGAEFSELAQYLNWDIDWRSAIDFPLNIDFSNREKSFAFYLQNKTRLGSNLLLTAGIRQNVHNQFKANTLSPRLQLVSELTPSFSVSSSWGLYYQYPSIFSTILRGIPIDISGSYLDLKPEKASYFAVGSQLKVAESFLLQFNSYRRILWNILLADESMFYFANNTGNGFAKGFEVQLQNTKPILGKFSLFIAYAWAKSQYRTRSGDWTFFDHDRRHSWTCSANLKLTNSMSLDMQYKFGTGFPYTPYLNARYSPNSWNADPDGFVFERGIKNSSRFPSFQRADVRINYIKTYNRVNFSTYIEFINLFNCKNVFMYEWDIKEKGSTPLSVQQTPFYMMPFIPMIGVRIDY